MSEILKDLFKENKIIYRFFYSKKEQTKLLWEEHKEELNKELDLTNDYLEYYDKDSDDKQVAWIPLSEKNVLDLVPKGDYCYRENLCPFWMSINLFPKQSNGYCSLLEIGDFMHNRGTMLLWDQVKECGINPADERDYFASDEE